VTYRMGDPVIFKGEKRGGIIHVLEPVYRGVKTPGTDRWRFHLLLGKGAQVAAGKCKEADGGRYESREELIH
jgi:hypothetical protein